MAISKKSAENLLAQFAINCAFSAFADNMAEGRTKPSVSDFVEYLQTEISAGAVDMAKLVKRYCAAAPNSLAFEVARNAASARRAAREAELNAVILASAD